MDTFRILPKHYFENIEIADSMFDIPKFRTGLNITPDWLWAPKSFPIDVTTGEDFTEKDLFLWKYIHSEFESRLDDVCEFSGYNQKDLKHIWYHLQEDVWDPESPGALQNDDIHKDVFENMTKVINMQVYMGETHRAEDEALGTMFWEYIGNNPGEELGSQYGEFCVCRDPGKFKLIDHAPYRKNTAIMYDPGISGHWHSAPTHDVLFENKIPYTIRRSIIARYCFK